MSSDKNPADQLALTVLIVVILGVLCSWLAGCASSTAATAINLDAEPAFTLKAMPMILLSGGAVRLTCIVPRSSTARRVRLALEEITASDRQLDQISNQLLVERVPCGTWLATCTLSNGERRDLKIESRGECNGDIIK